MKQIALEVKKRTETGKTAARKSRKSGLVFGTVYGANNESLNISIPYPALDRALSQGAAHQIVNLKIDADGTPQEKLCIIQELQRDIIARRVIHVDLHHISMDKKLTANIPLSLQGEPAGVREGGILDHVLWEVEVKALPINLPEKLVIDVSPLAIHQSLHVRDIPLPEGVEIVSDPAEVVAVVHPPRTEETPVPAAAAAAGEAGAAAAAPAQPEVISKGKKEEEGAGEESKPKK